jgi:hypothetical protein
MEGLTIGNDAALECGMAGRGAHSSLRVEVPTLIRFIRRPKTLAQGGADGVSGRTKSHHSDPAGTIAVAEVIEIPLFSEQKQPKKSGFEIEGKTPSIASG